MGSEQKPAVYTITDLQGMRLLRIKGTRPFVVWIAGPAHSWWMHWCPIQLRTQPCITDNCGHCESNIPRRPMSYLPVFQWSMFNDHLGWYRAVLEVPLRTGLQLTDMQGRGVSLRRLRVCGPIEISPATCRCTPDYAEAWDIVPGLVKLWRLAWSQQLSLVSRDPLQ